MRRSATLVLLAICLIGAGCGATADEDAPGEQTDEVRYVDDGTFTIARADDPGSYDPYHTSGVLGLDDLAYDSLVNLRPDGEYVSGLAQEWSVDATSATFTLRPDVTCSDGTPLTATAVAEAITYVSDPANTSPLYGQQTPTVPLTATGDDTSRTVEVVLAEPFGLLLESIGTLPIVCPAGMQDPTILETGSSGTGPYELTTVTRGQTWTFTRRDDYAWGADGATTSEPGMPATVEVRIIPNETTAANLLLSGELNFVPIAGEDHRRLDAAGLDKMDTPGGLALWFNQTDGRVTTDERLRRAVIHALDLDELVSVSTGGAGSAATGLVALEPKVCDGDTLTGQLPEHDVAAAEALLDEAGWVEGPDGTRSKDGQPLALDLHYIPPLSRLDAPTAELVARQLEAVGVQVNLSADGPNGYVEVALGSGDWDLYVLGYGFYLPSQWIPFASGALPPDGVNISGIDNPDYDRLVARAQTMTPPQACEYWTQAEQALFQNVDIAPISFRSRFFYLSDAQAEVTGFAFPIPTSMRVLE